MTCRVIDRMTCAAESALRRGGPQRAAPPPEPEETAMSLSLPAVLKLDAVGSLGFGLVLLAAAGPLSGPLGLSETLLRVAGLLCLPSALVMWRAARGSSPALVATVIWGNVGWVAASVAVLALAAPTALGAAVVIAQGAWVGWLAFAQRRAATRRPA